MPDKGGSLAAERFDITPVVQEMVAAQGWEASNDLVICFVDNGSRGYSIVSPAATLTATFSASGVEPSPDDDSIDCLFDTNGDGFVDKAYADTDGDDYCNFPAGTE